MRVSHLSSMHLRSTRIAIGLTVAMVAAVSALAQSAGTKSVSGPFNGTAKQQRWALRSAALLNPTDAPLRVLVACPADDPDLGRMQYGREVEVPAGCQRTAYFAFRAGVGNRAGTAAGKDRLRFTVEAPVTAWNAATGERLNTDPGMRAMLANDAVGLALISGNTSPYDTDSYIHKNINRPPFSDARVISDQPDNSPDRWYGYDVADLLLVRSVAATDITPAQVRAILDWTRRGGTTVLCGSQQLGDLLTTPLGEAAGVCQVGTDWPDRLTVDGPDVDSVTVDLDWPLPRSQLMATTAEVIYTADSLPLLTHRPLGNGHLFVLATATGSLQDEKLHPVWLRVGETLRNIPAIDPDRFAQAAVATLRQIEGRPAPSRTVPFFVLVGLAGAVIVVGCLLRLRRRGELLWLVLIPLTLIIGVVMYAVSRIGEEPQRLTHVGLISDVDAQANRSQGVFSYFSGPNSGEMDFAAGTPLGVIRSLAAAGSVNMDVHDVRTTDRGVTLVDRIVRPQATTGLTVDTMQPGRSTTATITFGPEGAVATVANHLDQPLEQSVLYINKQTFAVGDVAVGGTANFMIGETSRLGEGEFTSGLVPNQRRNQLIRSLLPKRTAISHVSATPTFIAYTPLAPAQPLGQADIRRQGWSVVLSPVVWKAPPAGQTATIPAGMTDVQILRRGGAIYNTLTGEFVEARNTRTVWIAVRPPDNVVHLTDATATLAVDIRASGYALEVGGAKAGPRSGATDLVSIQTVRNPLGRVELTVPDANRFRAEDGWYTFVLNVESLDPTVPMTERPAWQFQDIQAALKGTTE